MEFLEGQVYCTAALTGTYGYKHTYTKYVHSSHLYACLVAMLFFLSCPHLEGQRTEVVVCCADCKHPFFGKFVNCGIWIYWINNIDLA